MIENEIFNIIDYVVKRDTYQFILYRKRITNHRLARDKEVLDLIGYYHNLNSLLIAIRKHLITDSIKSNYDFDNLEFNIKEIDSKLKYLQLPEWMLTK